MKTMPVSLVCCLLLASARAEFIRSPGPDSGLDLHRGLVAHYRFHPHLSPGDVVEDGARGEFDLKVRGQGIASCDGVQGPGARLSGSWLQAEANPLAGAEAITVSLWFRTADPTANIKLIGAARWAGGNDASGWVISTHASEFWANDRAGSLGGTNAWKRSGTFAPGEWNHLAVTYDGSRLREFINGALSVQVEASGACVGSGAPMTVGSWDGRFPLTGDLDEIRLYRRALAGPEIQFLSRSSVRGTPPVNSPHPGNTAGLTGTWRGKAVNASALSDCVVNLVEASDGRLTGTWGCPGVSMVDIEHGERLGPDLVRWESTQPGVLRWVVTGRLNGKSMVLESITRRPGQRPEEPMHNGAAVLLRE